MKNKFKKGDIVKYKRVAFRNYGDLEFDRVFSQTRNKVSRVKGDKVYYVRKPGAKFEGFDYADVLCSALPDKLRAKSPIRKIL